MNTKLRQLLCLVMLVMGVMASPCVASDKEEALKRADALTKQGLEHWNKGEYAACLEPFQKALDICREVLGEENLLTAKAYTIVANTLDRLSKYDNGLRLHEKSLAISVNLLGSEHKDTALLYHKVANALRETGDYDRANEMNEKALTIRIAVLGDSHPDTLSSYSNLAHTAMLQGDLTKAKELYERALNGRIIALGELHPVTAESYNNLAEVFAALGRYAEAKSLHEKCLSIILKHYGEEHPVTASLYYNMAMLLDAVGDYGSAKDLHEKALTIRLKVLGGEHTDTLASYRGLARILYFSGQYSESAVLNEKVLAITRKVRGDNHPETADTYDNFAVILRYLGKYAKSLEFHETALNIRYNLFGEKNAFVAKSYINLANIMYTMGAYEKGREFTEKALAINLDMFGSEHIYTALTYNNLHFFDKALGRLANAKESIEKAIHIQHNILGELHPDLAIYYSNFANVLLALDDDTGAREMNEKALSIRLRVLGKEHPNTAFSYNGIASVASKQGEHVKAHEYYEKAFRIAIISANLNLQQRIGLNLSYTDNALNQPEAAIFYAKICVNILQSIRAMQKDMDQSLQQSFLSTVEKSYQHLASLLTAQGRLVEAQQVLNMLKEKELYDFFTRAVPDDPRTTTVSYIGPEVAALDKMQACIDTLTKLTAEIRPLAVMQQKDGITPEDQARLDALRQQISEAEQPLTALMDSLQDDLAVLSPQKSDMALKAQLGLQSHLKPVLDLMQPGTVLLHTIMAEDTLWILATTPGGELPVARKTDIKYADLSVKIRDFRQTLVDRATDPRPLAQELYAALISPVQDILDAENAHTLLLSLDGPLRYIPPAALHDGNRWLAEKYAVSIFTEAARDNLRQPQQVGWRVAGMGVTQGHGTFSPLPAVAGEMAAIVQTSKTPKGSLPGEYVLDSEFTAQRMQTLLQKKYPVVHMATHFQFNPGTVHSSYVLTGDGQQLTLAELKDESFPFAGVDQLTLSACNTAMTASSYGASAGSEVEGFGTLAQRKGAQTVLATLWPVADASTGTLMAKFYREKQPGTSKAEALRLAQVACLSGTLQTRYPSTIRGVVTTTTDAKTHTAFPGFSHPYFWAPFILMGNWQ